MNDSFLFRCKLFKWFTIIEFLQAFCYRLRKAPFIKHLFPSTQWGFIWVCRNVKVSFVVFHFAISISHYNRLLWKTKIFQAIRNFVWISYGIQIVSCFLLPTIIFLWPHSFVTSTPRDQLRNIFYLIFWWHLLMTCMMSSSFP